MDFEVAISLLTIICSGIDNFKPESVDTSKPGVVEVKRGKEVTTAQVERPVVQVWGCCHLKPDAI